MTSCSILNCGKPIYRRGWCRGHYARFLNHGDPLGGRTFWGEPDRYLNEEAFVYTGDDCLIWPYNRDRGGYGLIRRDGRTHLVSRLVCEHRHGPPPTPEHQAAHSCGRGKDGCVNPRHLTWKTPVENAADKLLHGTLCRGESNSSVKLTEDDVREIRFSLGTVTQRELAERFGVSKNAISNIKIGKTWGWLV